MPSSNVRSPEEIKKIRQARNQMKDKIREEMTELKEKFKTDIQKLIKLLDAVQIESSLADLQNEFVAIYTNPKSNLKGLKAQNDALNAIYVKFLNQKEEYEKALFLKKLPDFLQNASDLQAKLEEANPQSSTIKDIKRYVEWAQKTSLEETHAVKPPQELPSAAAAVKAPSPKSSSIFDLSLEKLGTQAGAFLKDVGSMAKEQMGKLEKASKKYFSNQNVNLEEITTWSQRLAMLDSLNEIELAKCKEKGVNELKAKIKDVINQYQTSLATIREASAEMQKIRAQEEQENEDEQEMALADLLDHANGNQAKIEREVESRLETAQTNANKLQDQLVKLWLKLHHLEPQAQSVAKLEMTDRETILFLKAILHGVDLTSEEKLSFLKIMQIYIGAPTLLACLYHDELISYGSHTLTKETLIPFLEEIDDIELDKKEKLEKKLSLVAYLQGNGIVLDGIKKVLADKNLDDKIELFSKYEAHGPSFIKKIFFEKDYYDTILILERCQLDNFVTEENLQPEIVEIIKLLDKASVTLNATLMKELIENDVKCKFIKAFTNAYLTKLHDNNNIVSIEDVNFHTEIERIALLDTKSLQGWLTVKQVHQLGKLDKKSFTALTRVMKAADSVIEEANGKNEGNLSDAVQKFRQQAFEVMLSEENLDQKGANLRNLVHDQELLSPAKWWKRAWNSFLAFIEPIFSTPIRHSLFSHSEIHKNLAQKISESREEEEETFNLGDPKP